MKPDLGAVGFTVKLKTGVGRPELEMIGYADALTLGKMPAEIDKIGIVVMFNVGNGRADVELAKLGRVRLPDEGRPKTGEEILGVEMLWLATVKGNAEMVVVSVVVPLAIVVVLGSS